MYKPQCIYHIYNQGNNKEKIFFQERNYLFFIEKMRKHLLPNVDVLAYCLMPNHFHFLVYTKEEACQASQSKIPSNSSVYQQRLSAEISFLLSSYTKAINKQEAKTGTLFRNRTKYKECFFDGFVTVDNQKSLKQEEYASDCFKYIHENPVKAQLVENASDWIYSSAKDYAKMRNGTLCNKQLAMELGIYC